MTKAHTKSEIISFRTPTEPFQTWQVDLFGPLPITQKGNAYIFTAVDMFSKLLFCVPLLSSDSVTVSHALFQLVCTFGVCDCVISDKGSEFISQCTDQLCKILEVNQNFTPSFIHHCLGLCERTHRTVAERLTSYTKKGIQWDNMLPAITFSFNISPSDSTKYSPYEVVYGFRPKFPLSVSKFGIDLNSLHSDYHSYMNQQIDKLKLIREEAVVNAQKASEIMKERENKKRQIHLNLTLVILKRAITNSEPTSNVVSDEPNSKPSVNNNLRTRPVRQIRKPMRYRSELGNISESTVADTSSSEQTDNTFYKVKRILAQRKRNECYEYLVQYKGEPAQNAIWTVENQLNEAAKQSIIKRPPPVID
ncbi:unnamed protein product [Mytilus coruscus]|uniref:Integrase catalytic domain-containing protein n=1 Tax=Mytilus coruscus TaxID=42192 RepID=A0A6J8B9A6_MYTCO|nr:unnamed protein product [Mytilus coruscus]